MTGLAQDTTKSAKTLATQIAKQMAREPLEVLKDVKEQTAGESFGPSGKPDTSQNPPDQDKLKHDQNELADKQKSTRLIEALNRELEDIHKQDLLHDLQKRISEGEEVPLEEYPELSMEHKQVLLAQMEAVKAQRMAQGAAGFNEVPVVHSKPSRRFGAGQKSQAQKEQTRVEKPVPPSG
jgi:hypothetical protein